MADEFNLDNQEWKDFKGAFNKTYKDKNEEMERYKIFLESKKMIEEHNAKYEKGEVTFKMGINQFTDRRPEEIVCCRRRN